MRSYMYLRGRVDLYNSTEIRVFMCDSIKDKVPRTWIVISNPNVDNAEFPFKLIRDHLSRSGCHIC